MLKEFPAKTKYFFNIVLPVALLLQGTLPTIEKKENLQTNFSELIFEKCNDPEHSHPPLSQREASNDPEIYVDSNLNHFFLVSKKYDFLKISPENNFNKSEPLLVCSLAHFPPNRGPPLFKV
mgnify:FL=1|jgi:hypothetical protein|tara:strand:- start:309 stop:674 length:366 start_codon:yes stop_codon:yes gene_type:complete